MNNASRSFAKKTLEELKSKMLGDIEMTPGKWVAAAVVASASLIAIGYLAGSSSNHEEVSLNKIQETREKMLQQGNPQNTQKDVHATVDSEEDEDERWNAFGQQQDSSELSEEALAMLYQKFIQLQKTRRNEEASAIASQLLYALEKRYGSDHRLYCILSLEICKSLSKEKAIPILTHALGVLIPDVNDSTLSTSDLSSCLKYSTSCCLQLANLLPPRDSLPYTEKVYQVLFWSVCTHPTLEDARQLYFLWASHLVLQYRPIGCWKKIEEIYHEFFSVGKMSKEDLLTMMDAYCTALHQQGRTLEAIEIFKQKQSENQEISDYIYNRLSKFYFFLDDFASTEQCILNLREFYMDTLKFPKLNLPLASYNELMTACLELGKDEEYKQLEKELRSFTPDANRTAYALYTRSKYLITLVANLNTNYRLLLKVCVKRPNRKEGEIEAKEEENERKLSKFYLEAFFENPTEGEEPLHVEMPISHYEITLVSPSFPEAPLYKWYLVRIYIYTDESKSVLLGRHYQLIYNDPAVSNK